MPLTSGQAKYWGSRIEATASNRERASAMWDLARKLAGDDDEKWADLVRTLRGWSERNGL
ncbi:hypothetical protein VSR01_00215 [Actinacidiphila sp. DG2A-62]|uniref:hypothetical protein n=1 Tax=Actinacidiphila sp. DG2A-62 TaxID=3108821 RepID=UPI002DBD9A7D|nr:hypothetical protein [Actinacidiphila sp. DG2A-62]MEC3992053.1 hypothetical protein [Actinacidiphila sp. DG2A-62]